MHSDKRVPYFVDPPELSTQVKEEITRIVFGEDVPLKASDLIFIFGGSHPGLWQTSAEAFHRGLAPHIIVTGGHKPDALRHQTWQDGDTSEALVIARHLRLLDVPDDCITLETTSTNTYENVLNAKSVYDFSKVESVLAVCKSYAVGRQTRTLRAQLRSEVEIIPMPFDTQLAGKEPIITRQNWANYFDARRYIFANLLKIYLYGQRGHLLAIEDISSELEAVIVSALDLLE